jgi:hypothetical protein
MVIGTVFEKVRVTVVNLAAWRAGAFGLPAFGPWVRRRPAARLRPAPFLGAAIARDPSQDVGKVTRPAITNARLFIVGPPIMRSPALGHQGRPRPVSWAAAAARPLR